MKTKIIILIAGLLAGVGLSSSCQSEMPAPASIEGTWMGINADGTKINITFCNETKADNGDNSKLCITIPDLIIYTSGNYSYSDGYATMVFRNTLSASEPQFYATMIYDETGGFTFRIPSIESPFSMNKM